MKNRLRIISATIDLIIIIVLFVFPTWDYAKSSYYSIYGAVWEEASTIGILLENLFYNDLIAKVFIFTSVVLLLFSAIALFLNKKIGLIKKLQIPAFIAILVTFFLYQCSVFPSYADYVVCEMNVGGFLVIIFCVTNIITSFFISEKTKSEHLEPIIKPDYSPYTNTTNISTQLIEYKKMLDNGLITEEDFIKIKEKILNI